MLRVCIASGQRRHTPSCTDNKTGMHLMAILSTSCFFFLPAELYVCIIEYWQGDWVFCCWLFIWFGFFFFSRRKNGGKSPIFIIADYKRQSCSCLSGVNTSLFHTTCVMVMLRWWSLSAFLSVQAAVAVAPMSRSCSKHTGEATLADFFFLLTSSTTVKSKYSVNAVIVV